MSEREGGEQKEVGNINKQTNTKTRKTHRNNKTIKTNTRTQQHQTNIKTHITKDKQQNKRNNKIKSKT